MVVNQWHVIQAEQPNGFIDEWHLKLLLEKQCSSWITQAGTEPYHAAVPLLKAKFCFSLRCFKSWATPNFPEQQGSTKAQAHSCTAQRRSPGVISSKCHTAEMSWAGTLHKPVCCSSLPSTTGTNVTRATTWSWNAGVGFLFCAPHSYGVYKLLGAHLFPTDGSTGWERDAAQLNNSIISLPVPGLTGFL